MSEIEIMLERYGDAIYRTCVLYLRDKAAAEDAVQETFIKAFEKFDTFQGASSEKTWLVRIAINTCKDYLKSNWNKRVQLGLSTAEEWRSGEEEDGADAVIRREQNRELVKNIMDLPEMYRDVIVLHYYHELKLREIGEMLDISPDVVKTRLARAREKLKGLLECV